MIISSFCVCFGQLFWKLSHKNGIFFLIIGFALYSIGAVIMIIAFKYGSLSVLQPVLSINYVLTIFIGYNILNEEINLNKVIGICSIILGLLFICGSDD